MNLIKQIADVLLKYQWPMVNANTSLTKEEKNELLTPDKPYAEENFIRKKLKDINPNYDVVFVPTTLYELFVISQYVRENENSLTKAYAKTKRIWNAFGILFSNPDESNKVYQFYKNVNNEFYKEAFFVINNQFIKEIYNIYPELLEIKDANTLSEYIKIKANDLAAIFIKSPIISKKPKQVLFRSPEPIIWSHQELDENRNLIKNKPISDVIELEYKSRELNKGLLLRGTETKEVYTEPKGVIEIIRGMIASSHELKDLSKNIKENSISVYSSSLGNSLFAGNYEDPTACVYYYLNGRSRLGYALLIDKEEYINNNLNDLFFISPIAPVAALIADGEFFHSRSKVPVYSHENLDIEGIYLHSLNDPLGILTVQRNPLYQAELFAKFLHKNMKMINTDVSQLTPEQLTKVENQQKANQLDVAQYYKPIRVLEPFAVKASKKIRRKILEKKYRELICKKNIESSSVLV
ncbi:MAG: hypothetical protein P4L22_04860 [Candidatus Babeliales bacterium]|nr:hypothetical protein [Candidatus Babeliales bacterium]